MKMKKVLAMACALALTAAIAVGGTLAYLTSTATVTNTFTVGNVAITLDEAPVDADGKEIEGTRVTTNTYKLLPGHEYDKDPIIHVDQKSEDCWLFVKVTNDIAAIEDATTIANQMAANDWTLVEGTTDVYAHKDIAKAGANVTVFETFKIKGDVSNDTLAGYVTEKDQSGAVTGGEVIKVIAYAIQSDGFATAKEAWDAAKLA